MGLRSLIIRYNLIMNILKNLSLLLILISFFIGSTNCQTSPAGNVSGPLETWNKVTIDFEGPEARESDSNPNPFLDYRLEVDFSGPQGEEYHVPGFFAGDGNGEGTGNIWRVHFSPDAP